MTIAGILLSLLSGALLGVSFTPWNVWQLGWVALVPLFAALLREARTRAGFGLYCAAAAVAPLYAMCAGLPPGYEAVYALPAAAALGVFAFTFWQRDMALRRNGRLFPLLAACGIAGLEFARSHWILGSFASLGVTQHTQPAAIQIAWLTGVPGVSAMLVCANAALALLLVNARNPRAALPQIAGSAAAAALLMGANLWLQAQPLPETGRVTVAAAQLGFVPEAETQPAPLRDLAARLKAKDSEGAALAAIAVLEPLTREAAKKGARLVVWPETVLDAGPDEFPAILARLQEITRSNNIFLVFGYAEYLPGADKNDPVPPYRNMAAVMDPQGRMAHRYHKQTYVRMAGIEKGPEGRESSVARTALGRLGVLICYDADYPEISALMARRGAEILVAPLHDLAGFLTRHHPSLLLFRTVENRRALVKSDFVHGSLIADARGRIVADPPDGPGMALAEVGLTGGRTVQPWAGRVFGWACVALFAAAVAAGLRRGA